MSLDVEAINTGIYSEFTADSDAVAALVGGLRDTEAPQDPLYPYAVYQYITGVPDPTFTSDGEIINYQFSVYHKSDKPKDFTTINDAIKKLTAVFDDATLTIANHMSIGVTRGISNFLPTVDQTQGFVINYEMMIEDN